MNSIDRRKFITNAGALAAGVATFRGLGSRAFAADTPDAQLPTDKKLESTADGKLYAPGQPGQDYTPVLTPNGSALPWKIVDGVKVYHMIAEEVRHEFAPGLMCNLWGYNGQVHGPTIEAVEGDRIRIYVTNRLSTPTTVHWHGLFLPNGMDGVGGLTQRAIPPGETFKYEYTLKQHGTFMYHSHHDEMTQIAMGMIGMFVVHPRKPQGPKADRDFAIMLSEWAVPVGTSRPNPNEMNDFNILTMNAKCFPATAPLVVGEKERVRIRIGNLSPMHHHPIHLHGHRFFVTETDGGTVPPERQWPETTVLVATGQTRTVEFIADAPGDWAMHCHMTHHVMNQMGDNFPNMIGVKPGKFDQKMRKDLKLTGYMTMGQDGMGDMAEMGMATPRNSIPMVGGAGQFDYITMGGMFTILKVRPNVADYPEDGGWYKHPAGEVSDTASSDDRKRDGIEVGMKRAAKQEAPMELRS